MERYYSVAFVTLVFGLVVFEMALTVSRLHAKTGILAPVTTGDPRLERAFRAHMNTVECTPIFLPSMWLFAIYWSPSWAAALGAIWLIGRIIYFFGLSLRCQKKATRIFHPIVSRLRIAVGSPRTHRLSCLVTITDYFGRSSRYTRPPWRGHRGEVMMKIKWRAGVDVDGVAKTESDHFALCLSCGGWFDMRDLAQVIDHAHDAEIDIKEGVGPPPRDEPEH